MDTTRSRPWPAFACVSSGAFRTTLVGSNVILGTPSSIPEDFLVSLAVLGATGRTPEADS